MCRRDAIAGYDLRRRSDQTAENLNPREPFVALVFPIAAFASGDLVEAGDEFQFPNIFGVLVAQLVFDSEAQRRAVFYRQGAAV